MIMMNTVQAMRGEEYRSELEGDRMEALSQR